MIDITLVGADNVLKKLGRLPRILKGENLKAMKQAAIETARQSKRHYLSGPRPEKLAEVSGFLKSKTIGTAYVRGKDIIGEIGTVQWYGRLHEEIGVGKMKKKRPFLKPALADMEKRVYELFGGAVQVAIRK